MEKICGIEHIVDCMRLYPGYVVIDCNHSIPFTNVSVMERMMLRGSTLPVAVKTLRADVSTSQHSQFELEMQLLAALNHPNIVGVVGVCMSHPLWLVLERMAADLKSHLREHGETLKHSPDIRHVLTRVRDG